MSYIFEIIDKTKRRIRLTSKQWLHIVKKHPVMANYIEEIKVTIQKPDKIIDIDLENIRYYYKYFKHRDSQNKFLLIVVKYLNGEGFIMSEIVFQFLSILKTQRTKQEGFFDIILLETSYKMNNHTYEIYYDEEGDFLEITFNEPSDKEYADEPEKGVFITKDEETEQIKSIGILAFKKRPYLLKKYLDKINIRIPLNINPI